MSATTTDLSAYTTNDAQVWVKTPEGGLYAYRTGLSYSVARQWASAWNNNRPGDVPAGSTFIRVTAETTFSEDQ